MAVEDWVVQSPWPESEVLVDGSPQPVSAEGTFRVYLTDGKVHQIRRREETAEVAAGGILTSGQVIARMGIGGKG